MEITLYSIEPRTRKYVKEHGFLSIGRNTSSKYGRQLLDTATKAELDSLRTANRK